MRYCLQGVMCLIGKKTKKQHGKSLEKTGYIKKSALKK